MTTNECVVSGVFSDMFLFSIVYVKGLQTTARGPNLAREAISSSRETISFGSKDILSMMKLIQFIYQKFADLVECNICRNSHIM